MLEPGTPAPPIEAVDQFGRPFRLSDRRGAWTVLYFYPKDETVGCTAEACAFRDDFEALASLDAEVVGVSTQDVASHRRFAERHAIAFRLLADPERAIARSYRALGILGLARRITYLIDPEGVIRDAYRSEARPASHAAHAKARLRELRGGPAGIIAENQK